MFHKCEICGKLGTHACRDGHICGSCYKKLPECVKNDITNIYAEDIRIMLDIFDKSDEIYQAHTQSSVGSEDAIFDYVLPMGDRYIAYQYVKRGMLSAVPIRKVQDKTYFCDIIVEVYLKDSQVILQQVIGRANVEIETRFYGDGAKRIDSFAEPKWQKIVAAFANIDAERERQEAKTAQEREQRRAQQDAARRRQAEARKRAAEEQQRREESARQARKNKQERSQYNSPSNRDADGWYERPNRLPTHAEYRAALQMYELTYPYDKETLNKVHRRLQRRYHPDVNPNNAEISKKVNEYYDYLILFIDDNQ